MKVINEVKYYVKVANSPKLAIKVYQTEDKKFHRFIAVISNKIELEDKVLTRKNGTKVTVKTLVSPKKLTSKYLTEFADAWVNNDFKSELTRNFGNNITQFVSKVLMFAYGIRSTDQIEPVRYNNDVKLTDWEFRMFYKPKDM